MHVGLGHHPVGGETLDDVVREACRADASGLAAFSVPHLFGADALTTLAVAGTRTASIELMSAAVPMSPRHPMALAQQALTVQAAANGRFTLGVGTSQRPVIEDTFGLPFDRPAARAREYLAALAPLLAGKSVNLEGEYVTARGSLDAGGVVPPGILFAAMGPSMLRAAGVLSDGTITWLAGPRAIAVEVAPRIRLAAEQAGRDPPRIVGSLPLALTTDVAGAVALADRHWGVYRRLPSYRRMLHLEGVSRVSELGLFGDERSLDAQLERLQAAGVTLFLASPLPLDPDTYERTFEYLTERAVGHTA